MIVPVMYELTDRNIELADAATIEQCKRMTPLEKLRTLDNLRAGAKELVALRDRVAAARRAADRTRDAADPR